VITAVSVCVFVLVFAVWEVFSQVRVQLVLRSPLALTRKLALKVSSKPTPGCIYSLKSALPCYWSNTHFDTFPVCPACCSVGPVRKVTTVRL
jgi:hypothetical protein